MTVDLSAEPGAWPPRAAKASNGRARRPRTITDFLRPHWPSLTAALAGVVAETTADVLEPWPIKIVVDHVLHAHALPRWLTPFVTTWFGTNPYAVLRFAIAAVAAIAILGAIGSYTEKYLTTSVSQWVAHDLRRTLYMHIQRLSLADYDRTRTGDLIARVTGDIDAIQDFINSALLGVFVNAFTLVGMIAVMLTVNWRFTLIALSVAPALFFLVYVFTRRIKTASREVRKQAGELVAVVEEVLTSVRVVKAFAREDYELQRFESKSLANVEAALEARSMKARLSPLVDVTVAAGTGLVLWYGARLALAGEITAGVLVVFLLYLGKMYKPMRELSKMTDTVSKAAIGYERVRQVWEIESAVRDVRGARRAPRFKGAIGFEHVTFAYDDRTPVLKDVSFRIEPGQSVALVGPSGTGKTTIVSLIARFYDPLQGVVRIDGEDIRRFKQQALRNQISFILQDTLLFRASIWENIAYGKPEASRDEIVRAARLANAAEFIAELPEGYDTVIGERGQTLSGGQRQRIAIARAIIRDTPLLILDEPTTGLDATASALVMDAINRLMEERTTVMVAHDLDTLHHVDMILVINDAELVESGTHDSLLAHGGVYAGLYHTQIDRRQYHSG